MITPLDAVCLQLIQAARRVEEAHYHLANPPLSHPRPLMDEANFHLVERNISMGQIGFDYYSNLVTYRV
ncbi:MAG: hypothetical protein HDQ44_03945 [Desulfovibrio sp.]|nr:hypothetical protein [Desulfovibrio sp.]